MLVACGGSAADDLDATAQGACSKLDGCRETNNCSPVSYQKTGPTDAPVGDPVYSRCDLTVTLVESSNHP